MAYTNTWSISRPLGSAQANTADDEIRAVRVDIAERLGGLFEDFAADPLVIDQTKFGTALGKKMIVHGSAFAAESGIIGDYNDFGIGGIPGDSQPLRAWVPLPNGVTVVKIEAMVIATDTGAVAASLNTMTFELGASPELLWTGSNNTVGLAIIDSGEISLPIQADNTYFLKVSKDGGDIFGIRMVRITYNTPDGRNTV